MKLLEAAQVNTRSADDWRIGVNGISRECGVQVRLTDACEEVSVPLVGDTDSRAGSYFAKPFAIEAQLDSGVLCARPDDESWLNKVLEANLEYPLSRALVIQPIAGTDSWINGTGVQSVALGATPTADDYGTAVMAARKLWFETVMTEGGGPILHVPPMLVPTLVKGGVLQVDGKGEAVTILGDRVVIAPGYDRTGARVFFSGEIKIDYMPTDSNLLRHARVNDQKILVNTVAVVDVAPCSIVRVGAYS